MNINKLPEEIQNKIWNYYWSYYYDKAIKDIGCVIQKDKEIYDFLIRYALTCSGEYKMNYKYYFSLINNDIENICKNPGLKLISKNNNLNIKNISLKKADYHCSSVKKDFRYSCYYILLILRIDKRKILEYFNKF